MIKKRYPNAQVYNLDIVKPGTSNPMVKDYKPVLREGQKLASTYIEYDIRKPIENLPFTLTEDDVIFNFAAVHRTPGHENHEYFETNIRGAENVVAFAEKWNLKKIVFTSSIAPYGAAEQLKMETTLPTPNTAYGISKLVAEKIHEKWQNGGNRVKNEEGRVKNYNDRQLLIVRPGVVFGKGETGNFTRLYWAIHGHKFAYPGRKDTIKACIYVKELVRFLLWETEVKREERRGKNQNAGVEIYNCCFEPAYTIQHIVEAMKKVTGLTQFVPDIPNWVIMSMARTAMLLGSPMGICPARVKKLQISTNICGEKLKNCGYQFKWSFEEALEDRFEDNDKKGLK